MTISSDRAAELFLRLNKGDSLTNKEQCLLRKVKKLDLSFQPNSSNLQSLELEGTTSLEELSAVTYLLSLELGNTVSLEGISKFTNLQSLNLQETQVSSLKELSKLPNLQSLNLRGTLVSSLEGISKLTNLQSLDLRYMPVHSLKELESLEKLTHLYISGVSIDRIPKRLVDNNLPFYTNSEYGDKPGVYMKDVRLSEQPFWLFSQSHKFIEAYYKEEERVPINEAKVIFLGDGGVGKTYTIYRIEHEGKKPKKSTETTPGVSITQYKRTDKATINFWDFGGQEIMHSMHRCFLTERTCYVVTVSNRWSEVTRQARRWLKNIESFAPNSKVVLAVNCWDGVSAWELNGKDLKEEFPNLLVVVEYDARDPNGISNLKESIEREVDKLPSVKEKFPKTWMKIMEKLRNMTDDSGKPSNYITKERYQKICKDAKLKDVDKDSVTLLGWFNDLGVSFSYHKDAKDGSELTNYMILKPEWLTNAVYIIVNNGQKFAQQGRITHEGILEVLNRPQKCVIEGLEYSQDELRYILEVMRKFRLSFKVGDDQEFVPALCPNETPGDLRPKDYKLHVCCEVRYDYLPDSVVHRLMCDCSRDLKFEKCWLKGLRIDNVNPYGLVAVCDMGKDDDVLYVDVYQVPNAENLKPQAPQYLLRSLLNKIERINNESNLKSTIWICSDDGKAAFQLSSLANALKKGKSSVPYMEDGGYTEYNIRKLLGQVFDNLPQIERLILSEEKYNIITSELVNNDEFLKSILEKLDTVKKTENPQIININGPTQINQPQRDLVIKAPVTKVQRDYLAGNTFNSHQELTKQLEEFRKELNQQIALNEALQKRLNDAIQGFIDNQNKPKEKQEWLNKLQTTLDVIGSALDVGSKITSIAGRFGLLSLLGLG